MDITKYGKCEWDGLSTKWINKMNEVEMNDEINEMDFGMWNEWDESD